MGTWIRSKTEELEILPWLAIVRFSLDAGEVVILHWLNGHRGGGHLLLHLGVRMKARGRERGKDTIILG